MKVAVLGANGFIGSRFVEQCVLKKWADVVPVVRRPSAAAGCRRFALDCRVADALDQDQLARAIAQCEVVIHAAAGDGPFVVSSAASVYRAAARAGVRRMVYLSSMAVHGWNPPPGTNESSTLE